MDLATKFIIFGEGRWKSSKDIIFFLFISLYLPRPKMIKVILNNGEIQEVTPNIAHDLIDSKKAKLYLGRDMKAPEITSEPILSQREKYYLQRQMRSSR